MSKLEADGGAIRLSRGVSPSALATLFRMTVERLARGRRLVVLVVLFALPAGIALLARKYNPDYDARQIEEALIFYMIPHALVPLTALLFASGLIQDEVEEQTLTYLLMRPLPRWSIYLVKLLALLVVAGVVTAVFTTAAYAAIHWGDPELWTTIVPGRAPKVAALLCLALVAYSSVFGLISLYLRRILGFGVAYIIVFEGVFANIDFLVRKLTVMWHFRVLAEHWLDLRIDSWSLDLADSPTPSETVMRLAGASALAIALAAGTFSIREFRVKTPEGT